MRIALVIITVITGLFIAGIAHAEGLPMPSMDALKQTKGASVKTIIDPITLQLSDGQLVRLSGIDIPDLSIHAQGDISVLAMDVLRDAFADKKVKLHQTPKADWGRTNRMGHILAHITRDKDGVWAQGTLLRLGLARMNTNERTPELAAEMLTLEDKAHAEKLGLWADNKYAIKTPETIGAYMDSFQIIEGRVHSVSLRKNRLYINFGKNWKTDMTVTIAPEHKRRFSKASIDPQQWNGKTLRVRGWVRDYNSAYIEITHPQAVEVLN